MGPLMARPLGTFVHIFPIKDVRPHKTTAGHDCWCEPRIEDYGENAEGLPIRLFIHDYVGKFTKV